MATGKVAGGREFQVLTEVMGIGRFAGMLLNGAW